LHGHRAKGSTAPHQERTSAYLSHPAYLSALIANTSGEARSEFTGQEILTR
jgi:hypothetical protein